MSDQHNTFNPDLELKIPNNLIDLNEVSRHKFTLIVNLNLQNDTPSNLIEYFRNYILKTRLLR